MAVSARVKMYSIRWCGYCSAARKLLTNKGAEFDDIDVNKQPEMRAEMESLSGRHTVPQIFINGIAVGGFDDIAELERNGKLDQLLAEEAAPN